MTQRTLWLLAVAAFTCVTCYLAMAVYDPVAGRWTQRDPIDYQDSANLYQFCGNNPVNKVDADGRWFSAEHRRWTKASVVSAMLKMDRNSAIYKNISAHYKNEKGWIGRFAEEIAEANVLVDKDQTAYKHGSSKDWKSKADEAIEGAYADFSTGKVTEGIGKLAQGMHAYQDAENYGHVRNNPGTWVLHAGTAFLCDSGSWASDERAKNAEKVSDTTAARALRDED